MTSDEGLDVYGAATWGQFFIYQGFNANAGWMHTSTGVDNVDEFAETIVTGADGSLSYRYGDALRPVTRKTITLSYRTADGGLAQRSFTTFATHHGPIVREAAGRWIAFALMNKPVEALQQSFLRTKARDYADYIEVAGFKANSSNNTLFADSKGNIAFLLPQFMPIRDDRFDYRQPVDGSDPATDWQGLHSLESLPQAVNPQSGFAFNTNNWPWTCAGRGQPQRRRLSALLRLIRERPRAACPGAADRARRVHLADAARHRVRYLPRRLRPARAGAASPHGTRCPTATRRRLRLAGPIGLLRGWDYRWGADSTATSLAVFWGAGPRTTDAQRLASLDAAVERLTADFGSWQVPWGEINRFQRNDGAIVQTFDDAKPSIPVPFVSGTWGSLASYGSARRPGTKRFYGTSGNTFVAIVEFGPRLRARAVREGGNSGHPDSPHFKRPGRTLRERQPPSRLLPPRRPQGSCRAELQAGQVIGL